MIDIPENEAHSQLKHDFCDFIIPKNSSLMNNKQKSRTTEMKKKIFWKKEYISELKKLSAEYLADSEIAILLSERFNDRFTAESVKRKRQRMKFIKYKTKTISDRSFYVRIKQKRNSKGFNPLFFPLELISRFNLHDGDSVLLRIDTKHFTTKVKEVKRTHGKKNNFIFYAPYELLGDGRLTIVEYVSKIENDEPSQITDGSTINLANLLIGNPHLITGYESDSQKNLLINKKRASVPIVLSNQIQITKELIQSLGFFQGEGTKKHPRRVEITNSDSNLVKLFIQTTNQLFNLDNNDWSIRLKYNAPIQDTELEANSIHFWSQELGIPSTKFLKTGYMKGNPSVKFGSVQTYIPSLVLREIWMSLLNLSYNLVRLNADYAKWFLQGVLAADGCPMFRKNKLMAVQIRIENVEEGRIYMDALNTLDIRANFYPKTREIRIGRKSEMKKAHNLDLFILHSSRHQKFTKAINGGENK